VRSAGSPNTSRNPSRMRASGDAWTDSGAAAAGRARVPNAISKPDSTNVAESMASERHTPMNATANPPAIAPST